MKFYPHIAYKQNFTFRRLQTLYRVYEDLQHIYFPCLPKKQFHFQFRISAKKILSREMGFSSFQPATPDINVYDFTSRRCPSLNSPVDAMLRKIKQNTFTTFFNLSIKHNHLYKSRVVPTWNTSCLPFSTCVSWSFRETLFEGT